MRLTPMLQLCLVPTLLVLGTGCGPDLPSRGEPGESCAWVPFISCGEGALETCCTDTQCTYRLSDGTDFPCDGLHCTEAAHQATASCQG